MAKSFCGCESPELVNEDHGATLVVRCLKCGQSTVTTNPGIFERNPWLADKTEYTISVSPTEMRKVEFIKALNKYANIPISEASQIFSQGVPHSIFKGKGTEFYKFAKNLQENEILFIVDPACSYL